MLSQPGRDDHDGELDLDLGELDGEPRRPAPDVGSEATGDDCAPLDDDRPQVGYELFDLDPVALDDLDDALHALGIPHEWVSDGYEVVVHEQDEPRVDGLVAAAGGARGPDGRSDRDPTGDGALLGDLYVVADRLRSDLGSDVVATFLDVSEQLGELAPYGVGEREWDGVLTAVDELIDLFHAAAGPEDVHASATRLRQRLRPLV